MSRNTIKAVLSSIGFSGLLLVLGYMVDASQQQLLGFQVRSSQSIQSYLFLGGGMLVGTFVSAILWGLDNLALIATIIGVLLIAVFARKPILRRWRLRLPSIGLIGMFVLLVGIADIVLFDLPSFQLKEVLRSDVKYRPDPDLPKLIRVRGEIFWRRMICSRFPDQSSRAKLKIKNVYCGKTPAKRYARANRDSYLANAGLAAGLLLTTAFFLFRSTVVNPSAISPSLVAPARAAPEKPSLMITVLIGLVAFANALLLPWTYGRLQESTVLKEAIVRLEMGNQKVSVAHGFVLSEDEAGIALFNKKERQLWFIPREGIILIKVERQKDVIAHYYSTLLNPPLRHNAPPPPSP